MIILVGVTISFISGGGLLERTKQASTQYQIEADRETLLADVVASLDTDGKVDYSKLNTFATRDGFNVSREEFPVTATSKSGNEFSVTENGKITYTGKGEYVRPNIQNSDSDSSIDSDSDSSSSSDGSSSTVTFGVGFNTANVTTSGNDYIEEGSTYTCTITAEKYYTLPNNVAVAINGTKLNSSDYSWDNQNGILIVPNVTGQLSITVSGDPIVKNVTENLTNVTSTGTSTVRYGDTYKATYIADSYYNLPNEIIVVMDGQTLSTGEYTWNSSLGTISIPNVSGDIEITVIGEQIVHYITFNTTNVTSSGESTVNEGVIYTAIFTADAHYSLPNTITVTMGGNILSTNDYTWNNTTGVLNIPGGVVEDMTITVTGEQIVRNVTLNTANVTASGASTVNDGATYKATFTANDNYRLPDSINVSMNGDSLDEGLNHYSWNSTTGAFSISTVTGNISITVTGIRTVPANYSNAQDLALGSGVSLVPYSSLTGDIKAGVDNGKVSAVLTQTISGTPTIAVIPTGFTVSSTAGENTISGGLVVRDGLNNEFVWIPVQNINQMAVPQETGSSNYRGVLYNWDTDSTGQTEYAWSSSSTSKREPAKLTSTTTVNKKSVPYDSQEAFTEYGGGTYSSTMYQTEFNNMAGSVAKYKGFYVGRYETGGFNGSTIVSKAGEGENSINNATWYKMYKMQKDFASNNPNVGSSMIWGCQYDQVMKFVNNKLDGAGNTYDVTTGNSTRHIGILEPTGSNINDKVQNIYDLEGSVSEKTLEAYTTYDRTHRSGYHGNNSRASSRSGASPTYSSYQNGSRITLYIR